MKRNLPEVLILFNTPTVSISENSCDESDIGVLSEVEAVSTALDELGVPFRAVGVKRLQDVVFVLPRAPERIVFNLVEGFDKRPEEMNYVPALCTAFSKSCTGGDTPSLILSLDKWQTKAVLQAAGLPVPEGVSVPVGNKIPTSRLPKPPLIVKPACTDASEGIHADTSIFQKVGPKLHAAVDAIHKRFGHAALIEQFFGTREINVSVIDRRGHPEVVAIAEIDFSAFEPDRPNVVDYAAKWRNDTFVFHNTPRMLPAPVSQHQAAEIERVALGAWHAVGCRDYARVDLRMDARGRLAILEINTNPDIAPDAGFAAALDYAQIPYREFVASTVQNAFKRLNGKPCESENVRKYKSAKVRESLEIHSWGE